MLPVLFSIGPITISSFGLFLAVAFLFSTYLIWRLARAWDMDEEKMLDVLILTFFGGLVISRVFFIIEHLNFFQADFLKMIQITKYPGFSFWGGFGGGAGALFFLCRMIKIDFGKVLDISSVGFLGGLFWGNIGCFLGGCGAGIQSDLFFATPMVGLIGKRLPVQLFEAVIFLIILIKIWPKAVQFHPPGKIASLVLIFIGGTKFIMDFFRQSSGHFLSLVLVLLAIFLFYKIARKTPIEDVKNLAALLKEIFTSREKRQRFLKGLQKKWYNQTVAIFWNIRSLTKILRRFNVRTTPKNFK